MTTLFNRKTSKLAAIAIGLTGAAMVHAAGNLYFPYDAYQELSGTHATRISTGEKVELPKVGVNKQSAAYDAYEQLSGTHAG